MKTAIKKRRSKKPKSRELPATWGDFKRLVEEKGVCDSDCIYMIDIGPNTREVYVYKDESGIEIADDVNILKASFD